MNNEKPREKETCDTCKFWYGRPRSVGVCKRNAPTLMRLLTINKFECTPCAWPQTDINDWCGEHETYQKTKT